MDERSRRFRDRRDAGRQLAKKLDAYKNGDPAVVLGLPRGGVPVAFEVARALGAPLDVFLVRKLGVPTNPELAMGAVASGGVAVLDPGLVRALGVDMGTLREILGRELAEIERRELLYRGDRTPIPLAGRTVVLVDDGLATGSSMRAAIAGLRKHEPARVVVAVPVGAPDTCEALRSEADDVVCTITPDAFVAVGLWYDDFTQTDDDEVRALLRKAAARRPSESSRPTSPAAVGESAVGSLRQLGDALRPLDGGLHDHDALLDLVGDASLVLLGEASHGTHEFYSARMEITQRLVTEKGFSAIAIEGDWPDAYRVNRYVLLTSGDEGAVEALADFRRFPSWMWRNTAVVSLVEWLRQHNSAIADERRRVGFYGLDLYSLHRSIQMVIEYLERLSPEAAQRARERYACFEYFGDDPQRYGYYANLDPEASCEPEVVAQLVDLQATSAELLAKGGILEADEHFYAEQNARLAMNAEAYYRAVFRGRDGSWNLRDSHMVETLEALRAHLEKTRGGPAKIVVWAHNSHVGDARATEMGKQGEHTVGQLVRERHGSDAVLVGFTTYKGTVSAASTWGGPVERKRVRPALAGSVEALFHDAWGQRFFLPLRGVQMRELSPSLLQRAIGVIYVPETERWSHYFFSRALEQFDAVYHFDDTRAVEPLERESLWDTVELPETYPFAV
jgi:erythromycin esterase-like protein/predicted phosphoribosyltransferase